LALEGTREVRRRVFFRRQTFITTTYKKILYSEAAEIVVPGLAQMADLRTARSKHPRNRIFRPARAVGHALVLQASFVSTGSIPIGMDKYNKKIMIVTIRDPDLFRVEN
jgi:hypothetical protein